MSRLATHVTIIANPASRAGRGQCLRQRWLQAFDEAGVAVTFRETESSEHARDLAGSTRDTDAILVAGGDGTINAVINGWMQQHDVAPPMGVLYAGTSPDFCRFHCISPVPEDAVAVVLAGHSRAVDVGHVVYSDDAGSRHEAYFGCSVNIGIGASVASRANRWRPWTGDHCGTGLAVLSALFRRHPRLTLIDAEGQDETLERCCNLCVAKNPHIASGLRFTGELTATDGRLAILGIAGLGACGLMALLPSFYSGRIAERRGVSLSYRRSITVRSQERVPVEFDGDPHGILPVTIKVIPRVLNLLVPEQR